jgi:dipeptidyl aminopeptidase/acylaminoacyl peptidase
MFKSLAASICIVLLQATTALSAVIVPETIQTEGVPMMADDVSRSMAPYTEIKGTSFVAWYGDEMIVSYRKRNVSQLFLLSEPLGKLQQLTDFPEPVTNAVANASKKYLVFSKDQGGNEQYQLYRMDLPDKTVTLLTDGQSRASSPTINYQGDQLAFVDNSRTGVLFDVYIMDPRDPTSRKRVFEATQPGYLSPVWSYDGTKLLISAYVSASEVSSHLLDLTTGKSRDLTPDDGKVYFRLSDFTRDDRYLIGTSNRNSEFRRLVKVDPKSGKTETLSSDIPWDVSGTYATSDGSRTVFRTNENGISQLYLLDNQSFEYQKIEFDEGIISGYEPHGDGDRVALTFSNAQNNANVHVKSLLGPVTRWTNSDTGGLDLAGFVKPQLILYPTFDRVGETQRQISAFYYKPRRTGKHPVVIVIHGGPESQFRPGFLSPSINYWINELGIGVIAPNVRGSAGYGKTYLALDNGLQREDSVKDIGALIDWAGQQPEIDADRIAVYGGSYGGYMVLSSLVHYGDKLAAGVETVGISNFVTFLKNTSDYRRDLRRAEYGDERQIGEFLHSISPTTHAHRITRPLLVAQGAKDPRVPVTESIQIVKTLQRNETPVWYVVASNEGHGFRKKDNRDYLYYTIARFWQEHLLK